MDVALFMRTVFHINLFQLEYYMSVRYKDKCYTYICEEIIIAAVAAKQSPRQSFFSQSSSQNLWWNNWWTYKFRTFQAKRTLVIVLPGRTTTYYASWDT